MLCPCRSPQCSDINYHNTIWLVGCQAIAGSVWTKRRRVKKLETNCAVEAAIRAAEQAGSPGNDVLLALGRELEEARYEASLAARRYEVVDPTKRLVARELEARWNAALERVACLEHRIASLEAGAASRPQIDRAALMALAHDLPAVWNAPRTDVRTKQRLTHILIREIVLDRD